METTKHDQDSLAAFLRHARADRGGEPRVIVEQARRLLDQVYVHLPRHRLSGADPALRLERLQRSLSEAGVDLHRELLSLFTSLGDRHTHCLLPAPFLDKIAFLPFVAGELHDRGERHLMVLESWTDALARGDLLVAWNGMPMAEMLDQHMTLQPGESRDVKRARAVQTLSARPLAWMPPPGDEVVLESLAARGGGRTACLRWQVAGAGSLARRFGRSSEGRLRARRVETRHGIFGCVRVRSFDEPPETLLGSLVRLLETMPREGLILDLRGCEEGIVRTGERILQLFTPRRIQPEPFEFRVTETILQIVRTCPTLAGWRGAVLRAAREGQTYSGGLPLTSEQEANDIGLKYPGPVVIVVDALTYSTAEMVAAGFQDHGIGPVLGTAQATGGGGASPWPQGTIHRLSGNEVFRPMPGAPTYRLAVRRCSRVHAMSGVPLEGSGVTPDVLHLPTRDDLLNDDADLLETAGRILANGAPIAG